MLIWIDNDKDGEQRVLITTLIIYTHNILLISELLAVNWTISAESCTKEKTPWDMGFLMVCVCLQGYHVSNGAGM